MVRTLAARIIAGEARDVRALTTLRAESGDSLSGVEDLLLLMAQEIDALHDELMRERRRAVLAEDVLRP